jgi:nucleotide-binding universal stress UspA family protein
LSSKAIRYGTALAKAVNARVTGMPVSSPFHVFAVEPAMTTDTPESYKKRIAAQSAQRLAQVKDAAAAGVTSGDVVHIEHEHPYQAIIDTAKTKGCDLIVMASHGRRGISAVVLGSETVKVLTHSGIRCSSVANGESG